MIGYLEGKLLKQEDEKILLLVNQIGFEILLPPIVNLRIDDIQEEALFSFYIYYYQTERQPKPTLIGFNSEIEKAFFQYLISVEAIGPLKAVKALTIPIVEIAKAIEDGDVKKLQELKGIGNRTAQKIIATLKGKLSQFITDDAAIDKKTTVLLGPVIEQVTNVLIQQLGHKVAEANELIEKALQRNETISTPEALFDEIYRGEKNS